MAHPGHHGAPPPIGADPGAPILRPPVEAVLDLLAQRRSAPLRSLAEPGPNPAELERMLNLAARTPDHGRLVPWRFIVIDGAAREAAGRRLDALYLAQNPDLAESKRTMWTAYMMRAPLVVLVVSRPDPASKVPVWNQALSAGAVCMSLTIAAAAMGFATQWLLKWPVRDPAAAAILGVGADEQVAGCLHIGRPTEETPDRERPDLAAIVTHWSPDTAVEAVPATDI